MKKQITLREAVGKPMTNVLSSGESLIQVFGDEYVCLRSFDAGGDLEIDDAHLDPLHNNFGSPQLIELGIFTEEEIATLREKRDAQRKADREASARKEYERLRKIFETEG